MFELEKLSERCYYINAPAKIGIIKVNDKDVYLIDSGNDKDAGRKIKKILAQQNWNLLGILNTHSNADHIGGNQYLQNQTKCRIYSSGIEKTFTEYPILEPSFLYGGYPFKELRHKFLMAKPSAVLDFSDPSFPKDIKIIDLKGHFFDMVGFLSPDGIFFCADCLSSKETLDKYKISFVYDVKEYLKTLDTIENMKNIALYVPSHAPACKDIRELAQYNKAKVMQIAADILELLHKPMTFEDLLAALFFKYDLVTNYEQNVLVGSTVRSYLSYLKEEGKITSFFKDNKLYYETNKKEA